MDFGNLTPTSSPGVVSEGVVSVGVGFAVGVVPDGVALGCVSPPQAASIDISNVNINTTHRSFVLFFISFFLPFR